LLVENFYICPNGHNFPVVNRIPRFVSNSNYARSFGVQWNSFNLTQLDSYTKTNYSFTRLQRIAGNIGIFYNRKILEVGFGAGRFTEIILSQHGKLFSFDISNAVEANYDYLKSINQDWFVCQADVGNLPLAPEQFEIVVCIGVIQHTDDQLATLKNLVNQLAPGGLLLIDFYSDSYPYTAVRKICRFFILMLSIRFRLRAVKFLVSVGWPIHRSFKKIVKNKFLGRFTLFQKLRYGFIGISPIVDHSDAYENLSPKILRQWAILDTHDTLTDTYKHLTSNLAAKNLLELAGFINIEIKSGGNGIEARGMKPK